MQILFRGILALMLLGVAAPALAKTQDTAGCTATVPKSVAATHTMPAYPKIAVRLGESGETMLAVTIGADGAPISTTVYKSSGSERLDQAALDHVTRIWRWEPLAANCQQPVTTAVRVVWDLKEAPTEAGAFGDIDPATVLSMMNVIVMDAADIPPGVTVDKPLFSMAMMVIPESGDPQTVSSRSSGNPVLDQRAMDIAKTRYRWMPARMDGKIIGSAILVAMFWMPPGTPKLDPNALKTLMGAFVPRPSADKPVP